MTQTVKRDQRNMDAPLLTYDLNEEIARLKQEEAWKHAGHNSITLNMGSGLRIVVVALRKDGNLQSHKTEHPISVQTLEGELDFATDSGSVALKAGQILTLHKGILHSVRARTECAFLLTFGA